MYRTYFFNEDGTIDEVEMTTQGNLPFLNPLKKLEAARACLLFGKTHVELNNDNQEILTAFSNGDKAAFKLFRFFKKIQ